MKISVVIPAYNEEKYLTRTLESLKYQSRQPDEIIVVNNNCTDNTISIAKQYKTRVVTQRTAGASAARNAGAKAASGDVLVYLDADCMAKQNHIDRIYTYFATHPDIQMVGGSYIFYDAGKILNSLTSTFDYFYLLHSLHKLLFRCQTIMSGNFAIRRSVFTSLHGFNESINDVIRADDCEFSCRFAQSKHVACYLRTIPVMTSARRQKNDFFKTAIVRTYYTYSYLFTFRFYS